MYVEFLKTILTHRKLILLWSPHGADDYVNKPFKMPILLARISGLINSTSTSPETSISTPEGMDRLIFCGLLIDPPALF